MVRAIELAKIIESILGFSLAAIINITIAKDNINIIPRMMVNLLSRLTSMIHCPS